ncbi:MAG: hypothetical protein Q9197_005244 [Variospora fuerteventurae]
MSTSLSFGLNALVFSFLCGTVFSLPNQHGVANRDIFQRGGDIEKRRLCFNDDTLLSFKYWILDAEPYCSSLLGIQDFTTTVPQISRTTTTTVSTSFTRTVTTTSTEASVTLFSTAYVPSLLPRNKPDPTPAPFYQDNPYAYSVLADDVNAAIASSYFSACSCLYLTPSTVDSISVILSTRTLRGQDLQEATNTVIVTTGTSTVLLTRAGNAPPPATVTVSSTVSVLPTPLPSTDTSVMIPLSTASISGLSSSSGFNSSLTLSITLSSSLTLQTIAPTINSTSLSVPSLTPTLSANGTSLAPFPTGNQSSVYLPSSGSSSAPFPTGNQSSSYLPSSGLPSASGVFPTLSVNSTITSRPASGIPLPSINSTSLPQPASGIPIPSSNATITSSASAGYPTAPTNLSTIVTPSLPQLSTVTVTSIANLSIIITPSSPQPSTLTVTSVVPTGFPQYPVNASEIIPPPSATLSVTSISVPANVTIPSTSFTADASATSSAPSVLPTLDPRNCPGLNGTVASLSDGQQFAVVCETAFGGPIDIGLVEPTFQKCLEDCGNANNGFSAIRCRGVTYLPADQGGQNCYLKNQAALLESQHTELAVSAILINYEALNATTTPGFAIPTPVGALPTLRVARVRLPGL